MRRLTTLLVVLVLVIANGAGAAKLSLVKASTSVELIIFVQDSSSTTGAGLTGLVFDTSGLGCHYYRESAAADVDITLATATLGTYASGGFIVVDGTNMPGVYNLHPPDLALATGVDNVVVFCDGATNMAPLVLEIQLTDIDLNDGVRGGMTALPNVAAGSAGGLPDDTDANGRVRIVDGTAAGEINTATGRVGINLDDTAGTLDAAEFGADFITAAKIANDAIGATEIANSAIDSATFAAGAIDAAAIAADAIGASEIATDAIGALEIAADAITSAEIANDAIGATEIANAAIDAATYAAGAIDAAAIAANAIGSSEIATGAIDADAIATDAIGALEIAAAAITSSEAPNLDAAITSRLAPTTAARTLDINVTGEVALDLDATTGTLDAAEFGADFITAAKVAPDAIGASEAGFLTDSTGFQGADVALILTDTAVIGALGAGLTDLGGMSSGMKAEVKTEVNATLRTDTSTLPGQEAPTVTPTIEQMIEYLYKAWRHKKEQTATEYRLYDDAGSTVDQKAVVSDDGSVTTVGEVGSGP